MEPKSKQGSRRGPVPEQMELEDAISPEVARWVARFDREADEDAVRSIRVKAHREARRLMN